MTNGTTEDRLSRIEAILEQTAQLQAENTVAIAELRQSQERTHQQAEATEDLADSNAQAIGRTQAMLEATIEGIEQERVAIAEFRQAMANNFADTFNLLGPIVQQVQQTSDRTQALEAERQEWSQRFDNLLQDARADRQRMDQQHQEWMQRFDQQLADMQTDRERNQLQHEAFLAQMDERAAANEAEHNAFRQNIQMLLAEIARLWQRLAG